jgi:hypothetical protein
MATKTRKAGSGKKFDYVVAIPSYKRAETLRDKTLKLLAEYAIEPKRIHVFVANEEEADIYKKTLEKGTYGKIIVGIKGIGPVRNFIYDYFPVGKPIVSMDDDIKGFLEYDPKAARHEKKLGNLKEIIQRGFTECKAHNCRLWGIYPVPNGFFMNNRITLDLKYIIACFEGFFNPGTKGPKGVKINKWGHKDDYDSSIQFYKADGSVVRMNFVAPKTAYYTEPGGLQEFKGKGDIRSPEGILEGAKWIVETYPDFAELNLSKKSGKAEVKLKDKREDKPKHDMCSRDVKH